MRSMTGFGVGAAPLGGGRVTVEVRSLNHRYLDVRVRVPLETQEHAFFVEQVCRERLTRGRYDVSVRFGGLNGPAASSIARAPLRLDAERGKAAYASLVSLRDIVAPGQDVPLSLLTSVPELFVADSAWDYEAARESLREASYAAIERLNEMRTEEGRALQRELETRLLVVRNLKHDMDRLAPDLVAAYQSRLRERVERLLADGPTRVELGRLEMEVALLADKTDIAEELTRLESHFEQFAALLRKDEPTGRALDFLLQEMSRETNTIGSKCQDGQLSHRVVELKSEIERLREQVQNVE